MILRCSRGHKFDTERFEDRIALDGRTAGDKCPMVMDYDRMSGTTYCRRKLYEQIGNSSEHDYPI